MRRSKNEILDGFIQMKKYFSGQENPLFQPEYEASIKIISIIENSELEREDLLKIVQVFNKVTEQQHFDGSGWADFEIRIMYLLQEFGLEVFCDGDRIGVKNQ